MFTSYGSALRRIAGLGGRASERTAALAVFLASTVFLYVRILFPIPVGMADNSDGRRLICQFGANPIGGWHDAVFWWHTQLVYVPGPDPCEQSYRSSQLLLLWPTSLLTRLFFSDRVLDLRILGLLTVLLLAGAVAVIFAAAPGSRRLRLLFAAGLVAILADAQFADFIMSPYSEPAVLIGALYVVGGVLMMRRPGRTGRWGLALFVAASVFMLCAKTQTLTMILPLALLVFLVRLPGDEERGTRRRVAARLAVLGGIGMVVAAFPPDATPGGLSAQTRFNLVFDGILRVDRDPAADLRELGFPAAAIKFEGDNAWCTLLLYPDDPLARQVQSIATYPDLAAFLARHPWTAAKLAQRAAQHGFFQPQATASFCNWPDHRLGDYPVSAGQGIYYDTRFTPVDTLLRLARPGGLPLLVVGWALLAGVALLARRRAAWRPWADLLLFLTAASAVQFVTAAFGDGIDLTKHLNLSVFCATVGTLVAGALTAGLLRDRRRDASSETAAAEPAAEQCEPALEPDAAARSDAAAVLEPAADPSAAAVARDRHLLAGAD